MLHLLNPAVQRLHRISFAHLDRLLRHYRSVIDFLVDYVDCHAGDLDPVVESRFDRMRTREGGQ